VYALGTLLYLLLSGNHPVGNALRSPVEMVKAIVDKEPDRLSDAAGGSRGAVSEERRQAATARSTTPDGLRRLLAGDLDTIVAKALKKEASERYPSVTAFAEDLRRYLRDEPITARPDTLRYRSAKFIRRHRAGVAAAAVVVTAALIGAGGIVWQAREAARQRDVARLQLDRAQAANEFLAFLISDATPAGRKVSASDLLAQAETLIDRQFSDNPPLRAEMLATIGERYITAEDWGKAQSALERSARIATDAGLRARALCPLALVRIANGEPEPAKAMITKALADLPNDPQFDLQRAACLICSSEFGYYTDEAEPMIRHAREALAVLDKASVSSRPVRIDAQAALAYGYYLARENANADRAFAEVMAALRQAGRERTTTAADTLNNWGLVHFDGDILKAEPLFRQAVELHRFVEGDAIAPTMLFNYAAVLYQLARYDAAEPLYAETIRTARARGEHRIEIDATMELADLHAERGDLDRAAAELDGVNREYLKTPIFNQLRQAHLAYSEGLQSHIRGHEALARDRFAASLEHFGQAKAKFSLNVFALIGLARSEQALGHANEALAAARQAIELAESLAAKGESSYLIGHATATLGEIQLAGGDRRDARVTLARALDQLRRTLGDEHPATRRARGLVETAAATP
jgi:tetratricopeptide (TPR) repeat protein